jgi:hypothetical protein
VDPIKIAVCLDGRPVGNIRQDRESFFYVPDGGKDDGVRHKTVALCKASIEDDDPSEQSVANAPATES